jgi:hypothetical protein
MEFHPLSELDAKTSPEVLAKTRRLWVKLATSSCFTPYFPRRALSRIFRLSRS